MRYICVMASSVDIPKKRSNTPTTKSIGVWSSFNSDTPRRGKFGIPAILPHQNALAKVFVTHAKPLRGWFGPDGRAHGDVRFVQKADIRRLNRDQIIGEREY